MIEFVQHIVNGLSLGGIYALVALGYTMIFGILQLINFAHGDIVTLGAFSGYYLYAFILKLPFVLPLWGCFFTIFIGAMLICAAVGYCIERLAYRPLRKSPRINVLITTVGVSLLLEFTGQIFLGPDPKFFPALFDSMPFIDFAGIHCHFLQGLVLFIAVFLTICLHFVIFKTRLGCAMRAVSFHHEYASLMGIPTNKIIAVTFVAGSMLAGAAGILIALMYPKIDPLMGILPGLKAFTAAILGGIGNVTGAVLGAFFLGLAEEFIVGYWNPAFRDAFTFSLLILILLVKPTGLLGKKSVEKV